MNETLSYKKIFSELLRLCLVTSATFECPKTAACSKIQFRTISVLKQMLANLMTEMHLNDCLYFYMYLTDAINLEDIAKEFVTCKVERNKHFGSFNY